jgi:hypothetical protein
MASLSELVEAPVDWLSSVPRDGVREAVAGIDAIVDADELEGRVATLLDTPSWWDDLEAWRGHIESDYSERRWRERYAASIKPKPYPSTLAERFICEIHELLCQKSEKYENDRERLRKDFRVGEAGLVAGVTATISPYLGGSAIVVAPAVAITFTIIGRAGLATWCAQRTAVRQRAEEMFESQMRRYEADKAALEEYEAAARLRRQSRELRDGPSIGP